MSLRPASLAPRVASFSLLALSLAACGRDWDRFDPRLGGGSGGQGGTGLGGTGLGGTGQGGTGLDTSTGGAGQGGSGGEEPPLPCGGTSALAMDFEDESVGTDWSADAGSGAQIGQKAGEGIITLPSSDGAWATYRTRHAHALTDDSFSVEVTQMVDTSTSAGVYLDITFNDDFLSIYQANGEIMFVSAINRAYVELASAPYDPVKDRHWRIRESAGTTYWETSANGVDYDVRAQAATKALFPLDIVYVAFGAYTDGSGAAPGAVHFDRVNGGGAPKGKRCPASSFSDDFDDGFRNRLWDRSYTQPGCAMAEQDDQLVGTLGTGMVSYCAYLSAKAYDLTGDAFAVEVPVVLNPSSSGAETFFRLGLDSNNAFDIVENQGDLHFRREVDGSLFGLASTRYDPAAHRFWRIRESAGTVFWETSADGAAWVVRHETTAVLPVTALDVFLGVGTYSPTTMKDAARFDNLNVAP